MGVKGFGRGRKKSRRTGRGGRPASIAGGKKANKSLRRRQRRRLIYIFPILVIILFLSAIGADKKLFPQICEISRIKSQNTMNSVINSAVTEISKEMNLKAADFYEKSFDESGRMCDISVNTVLVNEFCARLAQRASGALARMGNEEIRLPVGSLFSVRYFANLGPAYRVNIMPLGNTLVDYDCSFESVGINQVNFQLWLTADSSVTVVNPLQSREINLNRKVSLVNTVISGEVPDTYLNSAGVNLR